MGETQARSARLLCGHVLLAGALVVLVGVAVDPVRRVRATKVRCIVTGLQQPADTLPLSLHSLFFLEQKVVRLEGTVGQA